MIQQLVIRSNSSSLIIFALISLSTVLIIALWKDHHYHYNNTSSHLHSSWTLSSIAANHPFPSSLFTQNPESNSESNKRKNKKKIKKQLQLQDPKLQKVEDDLARARSVIREAASSDNFSTGSSGTEFVPHGDIYRNPSVFYRSYMLMEKNFKIFVYEEGEPPIFHNGPCKDIYSMEGFFLSFMEMDTHFRTRDPNQAHVYFLPFSVVMILETLFDPIIRDKAVMQRVVVDYVNIVSHKYPFWNRSLGTDHVMLSCHDWGPRATWYVPQLYFNSIRVLCNANTSEHFNPIKDVPFPEINLKTGEIPILDPPNPRNGSKPHHRPILGFFAGRAHGRIRPTLFRHWKDKDSDLRIYETMPEGMSYPDMMRKSKFCICPSGHEVASPRIPEAIYAECVPVLISQAYVLPFSDVLNWDAFSIRVSVEEIPDLKRILMGVGEGEYRRLQDGVRHVQRHFVVNDPPKRFDVYHMIIHSIWLRRLNLGIGWGVT